MSALFNALIAAVTALLGRALLAGAGLVAVAAIRIRIDGTPVSVVVLLLAAELAVCAGLTVLIVRRVREPRWRLA